MPSEYFLKPFKIAKIDEGIGIRFYFHTGPVGDKKNYIRQSPCQSIMNNLSLLKQQ